jgi:hypothetical protein
VRAIDGADAAPVRVQQDCRVRRRASQACWRIGGKTEVRLQGNLAVTHWMAVMPEPGLATVWHAKACRDDGSWNHTVLALPLDEVPIGTQFGAALICDRAFGDQNMPMPSNSSIPATRR